MPVGVHGPRSASPQCIGGTSDVLAQGCWGSWPSRARELQVLFQGQMPEPGLNGAWEWSAPGGSGMEVVVLGAKVLGTWLFVFRDVFPAATSAKRPELKS